MSEKVPVLIMIQGHEPGARWKLAQTRVTTLGRSKRNQIKLVHPSVSRFHCEVSYINGLWYVADLNSKKGTYLNGREVTEREVIKPGDVIRLSKNVFKFQMVDEEDDERMRGIRPAEGESQSPEVELSRGSRASSRNIWAIFRQNAENFAFLSLAALVTAGLAFGSLVYANSQVHKEIAQKRQQEKRLEEIIQNVQDMLEQDSVSYDRAYPQLAEIIEDYPGAQQADTAAELYQRVEAAQFQESMDQVSAYIEDGNYRAAYTVCVELENTLRAQHLMDVTGKQKEYIRRLARAGLNFQIEEARLLTRDGHVSEALSRFEKEYRSMVVTEELKNRAQEILEKLRTVHERKKEWDSDSEDIGEDGLSEEEMKRRFKMPEKADW